tara:strand:+ start:137 stop:691 length:555 start_codon:yes stop_codon:yes gene_type:complete
MTLPTTLSLVSSVGVGGAFEKFYMFVEVIPREVVDVVCKPFKDVSLPGSHVNDPVGCETIYDAIIDAEHVGLALLGNVEPENLFFFFSESVQSLQLAFMSFCAARSIPYCASDFYAAVNSKKAQRCDERNSDPLAVVLCKLVDGEGLSEAVWDDEKQETTESDCCQISWWQLHGIKERLQCRHR